MKILRHQKTFSNLNKVSISNVKDIDGEVIKIVLRLDSNTGICDILTLDFPSVPVFVADNSIVEWEKLVERLSGTKAVEVQVFKQNHLFHASIYFNDSKTVLISCKDVPELYEQFK